jgi:hypothetical protein
MGSRYENSNASSADDPIGAVKFVLLHHDGCPRSKFHFRIESDGSCTQLLPSTERGQHPNTLGIVIAGVFDELTPSSQQVLGLKKLLVDLKMRYPGFVLGAHRQVRGDKTTNCPGRKFPMGELSVWAKEELLKIRNERIQVDIESQYGP